MDSRFKRAYECVSLSKDLEPEARAWDIVANFVVSHFFPEAPFGIISVSPSPFLCAGRPGYLLDPRAFFAPRDKSGKNDEERERRGAQKQN